MTQDSNMHASNLPNVISSACRSITLSARPVLARLRTLNCGECPRPIRCWNSRIWLTNYEHWAHLQCWQRISFFEQHIQLMADEIRQSQTKADEFPPSSQPRSQPSDNPSANNNKVRSPLAPATALGQPVEGLEAQQQAEDLSLAVRNGKKTAEERSPSMTTDSRRATSCVSTVLRFSGKVDFGNLVKIEGVAEGEITGDKIEIAESAVVTARITANRLRIGGQFYGEIVARECIELLPTARLRCAIITPRLVVAEGAKFDGDCKLPCRPATSPQSESHEAKALCLISQAQQNSASVVIPT